jgi:hypothetical protein
VQAGGGFRVRAAQADRLPLGVGKVDGHLRAQHVALEMPLDDGRELARQHREQIVVLQRDEAQ